MFTLLPAVRGWLTAGTGEGAGAVAPCVVVGDAEEVLVEEGVVLLLDAALLEGDLYGEDEGDEGGALFGDASGDYSEDEGHDHGLEELLVHCELVLPFIMSIIL